MPPQTPARSPLIEVSESLPSPYASADDQRDGAATSAGISVGAIRALAAESFARLAAEAAEGASAAFAVSRGEENDPAAAAAALLDGEVLPAPRAELVPALQAAAIRLDEAGRPGDAALVLGLLAGSAEGRGEGMLGLAVLALREGRIDEAFALAADFGARAHPRAASLLGICELERGNGTQAQAHLAAAARLARRDAAFRTEMQIAQRALLLMHLHS